MRQEIELRGRQSNLNITNAHPARRHINRDISDSVGVPRGGGVGNPARERLDSRDNLSRTERLGDVVICP